MLEAMFFDLGDFLHEPSSHNLLSTWGISHVIDLTFMSLTSISI